MNLERPAELHKAEASPPRLHTHRVLLTEAINKRGSFI